MFPTVAPATLDPIHQLPLVGTVRAITGIGRNWGFVSRDSSRVSALKGHVLYNHKEMTRSRDLATLLRERAEGFVRFAAWESAHPAHLTPADAVAAIGALYQLLPPASRRRPIDTSGVTRMRAALRHLTR